MNVKAVTAVFGTLLGCGLNNVFLEYIIRLDPGSGHLITFAQFLFIAIYGYIFTSKFGELVPKVSRKDYIALVVMFFLTSVVNNWAFHFNIPVPLHMIFRSGSLIANMIMGMILLKRRYPISKFISVGMISIGITMCTLISHSLSVKKTCTDCDIPEVKNDASGFSDDFWWVIGIVLLTSALLLSARMGIYQEYIYSRYGKHPEEALYYTHLYSLPGFLLYAPSIWEHTILASSSEPYEIPIIKLTVPILVFYLLCNVLTQFLCIKSVYTLTSECTSLTVTLVLTLRKFLSLIFSVVYFNNPFTLGLWIGTLLVFIGTLIFTEVIFKVADLFKRDKPKGD